MIAITVARKPLEGTVAATVAAYGTGGINIDASRISTVGAPKPSFCKGDSYTRRDGGVFSKMGTGSVRVTESEHLGRYPTNLILQHAPDCLCVGTKKIKCPPPQVVQKQSDGFIQFNKKPVGYVRVGHGDADGTENVEVWACMVGCPVTEVDAQSGPTQSRPRGVEQPGVHLDGSRENWRFVRVPSNHNDSGGVSRFFIRVGGQK